MNIQQMHTINLYSIYNSNYQSAGVIHSFRKTGVPVSQYKINSAEKQRLIYAEWNFNVFITDGHTEMQYEYCIYDIQDVQRHMCVSVYVTHCLLL